MNALSNVTETVEDETSSEETYTGIVDRDPDETLHRVDCVLAFLQDVTLRPNPDVSDWTPDEKYGIYLVFEEVRIAVQKTIAKLLTNPK